MITAAVAAAFAPAPVADIASRVDRALAAWGFDLASLHLERLGGMVRVVLRDGPALDARLTAAGVAVEDAGLAFDTHPAQRAIVAFSRVLVGEPPVCRGCVRGRGIAHADLIAECEV